MQTLSYNWIRMNFLEKLRNIDLGLTALAADPFSASKKSAPNAVKVPKTAQSRPIYMTSSNMSSGQALPRPDRRLINTDITTYRTGRDTATIIRDFAVATPDLSASVDAYIRTAVTSNYKAVAKNLDGTFSVEATTALQTLLIHFDVLNNYEEGFSNTNSVRAVAEALAKEFRYHGAAAMELVLNKQRLPVKLQPAAVSLIDFRVDSDGLHPMQKVDNEEVSLDIPTFFYRSMDQDLLMAHASSPMEAALQPVLFMQEFLNDLRRVVKQAVFPRMQVKISTQELMAMMPPEARESPENTQAYLRSVVDSVADHINGLQPEDALVMIDSMEATYLSRGNVSLDTELETMKDIVNGKIATGVKTMPAILGQGSSSNNIASTETLLFMKSAEGLQFALNDLFSQALTLAVRLLGYDVYVEFGFERIDLRPYRELEAFKAMEQSRVLELLSIGQLTDEEANLQLTGRLPLPGAPRLSGTFFHLGSSAEVPGNPYSGTSQGTLNQNLTSDAPKNGKSQNGGKAGNR